jgi:hypothetical protein
VVARKASAAAPNWLLNFFANPVALCLEIQESEFSINLELPLFKQPCLFLTAPVLACQEDHVKLN